jgi:hypothetical protein
MSWRRSSSSLAARTKCSHGLGVKEDGADRLGSPPELAAKLRQPAAIVCTSFTIC